MTRLLEEIMTLKMTLLVWKLMATFNALVSYVIDVDTTRHNPSLGLTTKAKACKGANQEWSPRVTFHGPKNVGECERMNLHTPKWASTLGIEVSMESRIFKKWF
jgi:hypothetical protein